VRTNTVRERLAAGGTALGSFLGLGSPAVAELCSHAGLDWLVIETEHNGLDSAEIEEMLRATSGSDVVPLVRVPSSDHVYIQRALDMGALGVVVPMIRSVAEAEAVVRATRYPPAGTRSFGPLRASRYSFDNADYLARANDNVLVVLILETVEAAAALEEIARVPGVDALWLGTFDLCLGLGLNPLELPHAEVDEIVERTLRVGRETGVAIGQNAYTPALVGERLAEGYRMIGFGPDYALLAGAFREGVAAFAAART
jgi:2-keto-3-deoxy-L-rhamnonate aldolase RhmA